MNYDKNLTKEDIFVLIMLFFLSVHNDRIIFALESSKSELSLEWFCKFTDVFQS